ncbi:MAG: HD domain-containing protein [Lachnospiraceae bacterium]|nr:HD domain-containing protein [Lachnospiraceae bacterium]
MTRQEAFHKYVELNIWIRELSSPRLSDAVSAEEYGKLLVRSFTRIGDISGLSLDIMSNILTPVLLSDNRLTPDERDSLRQLEEEMLDAFSMDNLDISLSYLVSMRLYEDAGRKENLSELIRAMDDFVMASYALLSMTRRLMPYCDSAVVCREKALDAANTILEYLEPARFDLLPDDASREAVLINARYIMALFDYPITALDDHARGEMLSLLRRALALSSDPFYRERLPGYDWVHHEFRTLQYLADLTIYHNTNGYGREDLLEINGYAKRMLQLWHAHKEHLSDKNAEHVQYLATYRCAYLAGELSAEEYRNRLAELTKQANDRSMTYDDAILHTSVPLEYILTLDPARISKTEAETVTGFYRALLRYVHRMPERGHMTFLLTEIADILAHFIDIEGGIGFEEMCHSLMAAIHPPTYVHSLSIADLSVCLATHLFRKRPELFAHTPGYPDTDAMFRFIWHAAACHDVGKLFIVETITTYGRALYNREFDWIQTHPEVGAALLSQHESTKPYAYVAKGHHRWFNGKGGYPASYHPEEQADRLSVDLIACADCLDASTDSVGRSYKQGKTIEAFIGELKSGSGTQYAPYLCDLFDDPALCEELNDILQSGRHNKYHQTYRVLEQ